MCVEKTFIHTSFTAASGMKGNLRDDIAGDWQGRRSWQRRLGRRKVRRARRRVRRSGKSLRNSIAAAAAAASVEEPCLAWPVYSCSNSSERCRFPVAKNHVLGEGGPNKSFLFMKQENLKKISTLREPKAPSPSLMYFLK